MNRFVVFFLLLCIPSFLKAQSDVVEEVDSIEVFIEDDVVDTVYRSQGYYNSIPSKDEVVSMTDHSFDDMISDYQSKDFEYIESISNKLGFFNELWERFISSIKSVLPSPGYEYFEVLYNLMAIAGGILVLFLIYKFLLSGNRIFIKHAKEQGSELSELKFVEQNLMNVDVNLYIEEALRNENFALAIRYQQLLNIQYLQRKDLIIWEQNKTNLELIENLSDEDLKREFMACSKVFDYVWFGDFHINADDYEGYKVQFESFRRRGT